MTKYPDLLEPGDVILRNTEDGLVPATIERAIEDEWNGTTSLWIRFADGHPSYLEVDTDRPVELFMPDPEEGLDPDEPEEPFTS